MDQQDMNNGDDSAWPELAADVTLARGAARSITLDTQRASTDGRIIDITAQLEQMITRLTAIEDHVFEASGSAPISDELLEHFSSLGEELSTTTADFESLASRVAAAEESVATTMMVSVDGFDARLAIVEDARLSQSDELNQLTSYLEQAFTRIAELAEVIEVERDKFADMRHDVNASSTAATTTLELRVDELHTTITALTDHVAATTSSIDASSANVSEALSASVADLEQRVAATEARTAHLDEVSASIQFLQARADSLDAQQHDTTVTDEIHGVIDGLSQRLDAHSGEVTARLVDDEDTRHALEQRVDETTRRIEQTKDELDQLRALFDQPGEEDRLPSVLAHLESLQARVDELVGERERIDAFESATTVELDAHRVAIDRVHEESSATRQLINDVSERIVIVGDTSDLMGQRIDLVEAAAEGAISRGDVAREIAESANARLDHAESNLGDLGGRLENAATAIDAAHTRIDDAEATAQSAHARLDSTSEELNSRLDQTAAELNGRLDQTVQSVNERIYEVNQDLDDRLGSAADQIDARVAAATEDAEQRLAAERAEASAGFDSVHGRIDSLEIAGQSNEDRLTSTEAKLDQTISCLEGVVGATAELAGRTTSSEERLDGVDERVSGHETQASALAEQLEAAQRESSHTSSRVDDHEQHIAAIDERLTDVANHVTANSEHLTATEHNVAEQAQHIIGNEKRIELLDGRIDELTEAADRATAATDDLDGRIDAASDARADALKDHLVGRVEEARAQLQLVLDESQAHAAESHNDLRASMFERLDVVESAIHARVEDIEKSLDESEVSEQLTSIESSLSTTDDRVNEAYAFTESLRQLQTDIVQALQEELRSHETLIDAVDGRLHQMEASGAGFASAERVHMLEAKLVEALQTISQLTQLQRRNTTVESQLTDTLTATSESVEGTQNTVLELRAELTAAQHRISHLEQALSTAATARVAQPAPAAPAAVASIQPTAAAPQPPAHDDEADTGWFTESYARKNQEPKAS